MAQFTVRVELHDAQWPDYYTLHAAMERQGFSRLITAGDGRTYQLPWAEYDGTANLTSMQVLGIAQNAANTTGRKNSVLVTEARSRACSGLPIARNIDADVVPCFEHRRYMGTVEGHWYNSGTQLFPDNGEKIINWPRQNYRNGVDKNDATGRRFKAVVRILKRLRNEMVDAGHKVAEPIPSYLIECLVWNVPKGGFGHDEYRTDLRYTIAHLWSETRTDEKCREWGEINELKYLFRASQPWSREQVNSFLEAAWNYVGFK